jgi:hypothetical protein
VGAGEIERENRIYANKETGMEGNRTEIIAIGKLYENKETSWREI